MERKHLLVEDSKGKVSKVKIDLKNVKGQIKDYSKMGLKAFVVTDNELINYNVNGTI